MEVDEVPQGKPAVTPLRIKPLRGGKKKPAAKSRKKSVKRKKVKSDDGSGEEQVDQREDEYAVERIVDKRLVNGEVEYFIKWQGWPEESNTWEPIEHLGNCDLMIQAYENKLQAKKKQASKRSRSTSTTTSAATSTTPAASRGRGRKTNKKEETVPAEYFSDSEEEAWSGVDDGDADLTYGILYEVPKNKELEKIHAVAVVDGYLTFLVQWKTGEAGEKRPPLSDSNGNMVRAMSLNQRFPQEVIAFYQDRVRFNLLMDSAEIEAVRAHQALLQAKQRRKNLSLKRSSNLEVEEDEGEDPATKAIEKDKREHDPYDPNDTDLSSSESDDDIPIEDEDDE